MSTETEKRRYDDLDTWAEDPEGGKRAETYGIGHRWLKDARRRIDARFADLDSIQRPGRTKRAL